MSKVSKKDAEFKSGQMGLSMKAIGRTVNRTVKVDSLTHKATCMKETGEGVKLMDLEYISMLMDPFTKVIGLMINKKEMV